MDTSLSAGAAAGRFAIRSEGGRSLSSIWAAACDGLGLWIERHRQRRALASLSDHMLSDIGISRSDAFREYDKPFWKE